MSCILLLCGHFKLYAYRFNLDYGKVFIKTHYPYTCRNSRTEVANVYLSRHLALNDYIRRINKERALLPRCYAETIKSEVDEAWKKSEKNQQNFLFNLSTLSDAFLQVYLEMIAGISISIFLVYPTQLVYGSPNSEKMKDFVRKNYFVDRGQPREDFLSICLDKYVLIDKYIRFLLQGKKNFPAYEFVEINDVVGEALRFDNGDQNTFIANLRVIKDEFLKLINSVTLPSKK